MNTKKEKKNIFAINDYRGERVIFERKKWDFKSKKHPELFRKVFIENIKKTLVSPDEVWEDYDDRKCKRCYYKKYSGNSYVKVVVYVCEKNISRVVTAFEINYIKETKYSEVRRIL